MYGIYWQVMEGIVHGLGLLFFSSCFLFLFEQIVYFFLFQMLKKVYGDALKMFIFVNFYSTLSLLTSHRQAL